MLACSIGIMAYNEEENIGSLLESLLNQELKSGIIEEIVVVASGCTDRTEHVVIEYAKENDKIKLLTQAKREGKASAINYYLRRTSAEIVILESADTLPQKDTIEKLIRHFQCPDIGMVGGHPIPVNEKNTFMGFVVHLLWHLHHEIALKHPKCGEIVAFRNQFNEIPNDSVVDEAYIESIIAKAGYSIVYAPEAIVWNNGPDNVNDFIAQRRRIAAGHIKLKVAANYSVATKNSFRILFVLIKDQIKQLLWIFCAIFLEGYGRFLGLKDCCFNRKKHSIWEIAQSTKQNIKHKHDKISCDNTTV